MPARLRWQRLQSCGGRHRTPLTGLRAQGVLKTGIIGGPMKRLHGTLYSGINMIRRALLVLAIAGIYVAVKRNAQQNEQNRQRNDQRGQHSTWANEGGANVPTGA